MDQRSLRGSADPRQQQWLDLGPTRPTDGDARAVRQEQLSSEMPSALNFASSVRSSGWRRRSSVAIAADGLRWLESLDMCTVSAHIATLTARLLDR
ncbi:MAG TPA: hypothetical protein VFP91_17625, partial [Vicinamibacterales bacterium]|nr:hypothetical protein [Vicinamibacterales bacterium]